ncbi:integral membrane sensor signal transduction histidine kinase [Ruminiclostridium papyrosolvens DSM 2782]|uniref:Integral membrane sensor signal transduction histidine kinase n=1 Tax=Ruminiclostridium papyrosolvens DSM 2782 TaxID=588581 RepID=F1TCV7_9FIRM|nr:histidine kinase [Ruminiclostridium papyrosolvens]EGD47824.1 integral membrane sensor signal transduction histidine kinase [Ruminiclostridium papyrosolvens DSM 2782]WES34540.1 histidine kinase [Ruminiclostridium papyrosolvens DSM 2782]
MKTKPRILSKVNDIPLTIKFLIIYVVCILTPIILINVAFLEKFYTVVTQREENNYNISMERAKNDINTLIEGGIAASHSISTDATIYDLLDAEYENVGEYYDIYNSTLRNRLSMYSVAYNYITNIGLYVDNPSIRPGGTYFYIDKSIKNTPWYKDLSESNEQVIIRTYLGTTNSAPVRPIQYLSILRSSKNNHSLGSREKILKVDISLDKVFTIFNRERDFMSLYLLDPQNTIVCSTTGRNGQSNIDVLQKLSNRSLGQENMVLETHLGSASYFKGWKLIGVTNRERISDSVGDTLSFVLIFAFISILISSLLMFIIVRSYNYRLKKLSKHMLKFKDGKFDLIDINEGEDEIGGVIRNFNLMAARINTLINDVYKLELQKKSLELERVRAEINFLQSQMNPHFLFNTLNAILVVSIKNNYTEIVDVIKYLSKTLRRLLSWKDDLVTIEEELSFTEMYLKIEKFRFCDKFQYEINVNETLLDYKIPKMSLQPLVENACKHGIQAIKEVGIININIEMCESGLLVRVKDNGSGMEQYTLMELMENIKSEVELSASIGLRNVYRRLRLYYGEDVAFNIESRINAGTTIYFTVPFEKL